MTEINEDVINETPGDETPNEGAEQESTKDSYEDQARAMGWKDLDEFGGDPEKHIPAEKFVKRGMEKLPILQKNYTEAQEKISKLEAESKDLREYMQHMSKVQYDRALKDIQAKQRVAVNDGDAEAYDALEKEKETIQQEYSPKKSESSNQMRQIEEQEKLLNWNKVNEWYAQDQVLRMEADLVFRKLEASSPNMSLDDKLRLVEATVRDNNPAKFTSPAQTPPKVAGTKQTKTESAKTWDQIPADDREKAAAWIKRGVLTKEQYVKDYFGE